MQPSICYLTVQCEPPGLPLEDIIQDDEVGQIIHDLVYLHEWELWVGRGQTRDYRRSFAHQITINGWPCTAHGQARFVRSARNLVVTIQVIEPLELTM